MANSVGHLYVTVSADVRTALGELEKLDKQAKATADSISRLGSGVSSRNAGINAQVNSLRNVERNAKNAANAVGGIGLRAQSSTKPITALQTAMFRTSQAFVNMRYGNPIGVIANIGQAASAARVGVGGLADSLGTATTAMGMLTKSGYGLLAAVVAIVAAIPLIEAAIGVGIAKTGLESAADLEMLRISYEGLLGTAQEANAEVTFLTNLAATSVMPTDAIMEADRSLLAFGIRTNDLRHSLVEFMSAWGPIANLNAAQFQNLAYSIGQIESTGKMTGRDIIQFGNASIGLDKFANAMGITTQEFQKMVSSGRATADVVLPAIAKMGEGMDDVAKKARNSAKGIMANLKDAFTIRAGFAFEGVLEKLKPLLLWAQKFLQAFDFDAVAQGITIAMDAIAGAFEGMSADAETMGKDWGKSIGEAVALVGANIANIIKVVRTVVESIHYFINTLVGDFFKLASKFAEGVYWMMDAASKIPGPFQDAAKAAATSLESMADAAWRESQLAYARVAMASDNINAAWSKPAYKSLIILTPGQKAAGARYQAQADAANNAAQPVPEVPSIPTPTGGSSSGGTKVDPAIKKWEDWIKRMRKLVDEFKGAYKDIKEMAKESFGELSTISEALLFTGNKKGGYDVGDFEGDVTSIIGNYDKLSKALKEYYAVFESPRVAGKKAAAKAAAERDKEIATLKQQTQRMVDLARENKKLAEELADWKEAETARLGGLMDAAEKQYDSDVASKNAYYDALDKAAQATLDRATEAYDAANSKLSDMISARDDFVIGIRDSARSLVNGLSMAEETIAEFTRIDSVGSFLQEEKTKTQTFKEALATRLQTMKDFAANVTTLIGRGLDQALLKDLVSAGPESAGAVLAELAGSSDSMLAEVNSLQADLGNTVGSLQTTVSKSWFDAAITDQQNYTLQQQTAMNAAQTNVNNLAVLRAQALAQLEEDYRKQKEALQAQLDAVAKAADEHSQKIVTLMESNDKAASDIAKSIEDHMSWLTSADNKKNTAILGREAMDGFIRGLEAKEATVVATAERIARKVAQTIKDALNINSPSKVTEQLGMYVGEGLALGMESSLSRIDSASLQLATAALPSIPGSASSGTPEIRVFIGDKELTDLIDIQIQASDGRSLDYVSAGRRY